MSNKQITTLYELYKDTPKKLKIVCDWDEVIQACEPYAIWKAIAEEQNLDISTAKREEELAIFQNCLDAFWSKESCSIEYSPYGSKIVAWVKEDKDTFFCILPPDSVEKQIQIKNSPDFYKQAPFLTIAEDLLKLIKEDKVESLIFLSAYDKRKFPKGDERKYEIFKKTFAQLAHNWRVCREDITWRDDKCWGGEINRKSGYLDRINFHLLGFDTTTKTDLEKEKQEALNKFEEILKSDASLSEKLEQTRSLIDIGTMNLDKYETPNNKSKADWIKENAPNFDIFIDDNPNICKELLENKCMNCSDNCPEVGMITSKVLAPHYPAIENQHHKEVLLIKNEVSDLKKEDFSK